MQRHRIKSEHLDSKSPRALIIAVQSPDQSNAALDVSCVEMQRLANTLGITVVERMVQKRRKASSSTFVGAGKLREIAGLTGGPGEVPKGDSPSSLPMWSWTRSAFAIGSPYWSHSSTARSAVLRLLWCGVA